MRDLWERAQMDPLTLKNRTVRSAANEQKFSLNFFIKG